MTVSRSDFLITALSGATAMMYSKNSFSGSQTFETDRLALIWRASEEMALDFADAMPAEDYGTRPVDDKQVYTYGGQMLHIGQNIRNLASRYFSDEDAPEIPNDADELQKSEIREAMKRCFAYGEQAIKAQSKSSLLQEVDFFAGRMPRWQVIFVAQDHTTHHLGQVVMYLRNKGIEPPPYRKWE